MCSWCGRGKAKVPVLVMAGHTLQEMVRKKVFLLVLLLTLGFLILYGTGLHYAGRAVNPLYKNLMLSQLLSLGLYFASMVSAFLAVAAVAGTIAGEIEDGTLYTIVTKPVRRGEIVLGKFLGLAAMLLVYGGLFYSAIILLNLYANHWHLPFLTAAGAVKGLLLFCLQPLLLLAVGMWSGNFLPTIGNGVLLIMLYGLAMLGGLLEQVGTVLKNAALVNTGIVTSLLLPTDAVYRQMLGQLLESGAINFLTSGPFGAASRPSIWMTVYALLYTGLFLWLAVRRFARRDL